MEVNWRSYNLLYDREGDIQVRTSRLAAESLELRWDEQLTYSGKERASERVPTGVTHVWSPFLAGAARSWRAFDALAILLRRGAYIQIDGRRRQRLAISLCVLVRTQSL